MSQEFYPERRVMDRIGDIKRIPKIGIRRSDGYVLLGGGLSGFILGSMAGIRPFIFAVLGFFVAAMLVRASVSYKSTLAWLSDVVRYLWRPNRIYSASVDAPSDMKNEGGISNVTPFAPDTRAQDLTMVDLVWPGTGAVLRSDYTMEAMVEIEPSQMDHAQPNEWAAMHEVATQFANDDIDKSLKKHVFTEPFDLEGVEDRLEERLSATEIQRRETLEALLVEYRNRRPEQIRERGTQEPRFFISVIVDETEIDDTYEEERAPLEKLARTPILGIFFSPFVTRSSDLEESDLYEQMFQQLDRRVGKVQETLVQRTSGYSGRRLSTIEMMSLQAKQLNGYSSGYNELETVVRESPVIGSAPNGRFENVPDDPDAGAATSESTTEGI